MVEAGVASPGSDVDVDEIGIGGVIDDGVDGGEIEMEVPLQEAGLAGDVEKHGRNCRTSSRRCGGVELSIGEIVMSGFDAAREFFDNAWNDGVGDRDAVAENVDAVEAFVGIGDETLDDDLRFLPPVGGNFAAGKNGVFLNSGKNRVHESALGGEPDAALLAGGEKGFNLAGVVEICFGDEEFGGIPFAASQSGMETGC